MTHEGDRAALTEGDLFPAARLLDQHGEPVPLHHQRLAGDPIVLFLCPTPDNPSAQTELRRLQALSASLEERGAHVITVTALDPADNRTLANEFGTKRLFLSDQEARLLGGFNTASDPACRTLLLRPDMRIAAILEGHEQAIAALAGVRGMTTSPPPQVAQRHAPVLVVDEVFPQVFCSRLIEMWQAGDKVDDLVQDGAHGLANARTKRRTDHVIRDKAVSREIQRYFTARLVPVVAKAFQFRVTKAELYRIGCYRAETRGFFGRHRDSGKPGTTHRRFAVSLNLNADYVGGTVRFAEFGSQLYRPSAGSALVFSCALLHEALPVSQGERLALFTFLSGELLPA